MAACLVDVTPDFRLQALRSGFSQVDAVLVTHSHADHVHGLDDLRAIYWGGGRKPIDLYGFPETVASIRATFAYIFDEDYGSRASQKSRRMCLSTSRSRWPASR